MDSLKYNYLIGMDLSEVFGYKRKQCEMSCPFDGEGELPLEFCAGAGYTAGKDFSLVIDKAFDGGDVFVIDVNYSGFGEFAFLFLQVAFFGMCRIFKHDGML